MFVCVCVCFLGPHEFKGYSYGGFRVVRVSVRIRITLRVVVRSWGSL